nr:hypothetical protein [Elizabethkingia sp. ASV34]
MPFREDNHYFLNTYHHRRNMDRLDHVLMLGQVVDKVHQISFLIVLWIIFFHWKH